MTFAATWPPDVGILVVGHGTADPAGEAETRRLAAAVAALAPGAPVELGFLEVIEPTVADALAALRDRGCTEVVAAPLLLFSAGHARRDLPGAIASAAADTGVVVRQSEALGCHPAMLRLSRERRLEARGSAGPLLGSEMLAFLVRGSSDPSTPGQAEAFLSRSLAAEEGVRGTRIGFVAAARPTVDEVLEALAASARESDGPARVLVQPHLLFPGHVADQVEAAVSEARRRHDSVSWVVVPRLGPDDAVAEALLARVGECLALRGGVRTPESWRLAAPRAGTDTRQCPQSGTS